MYTLEQQQKPRYSKGTPRNFRDRTTMDQNLRPHASVQDIDSAPSEPGRMGVSPGRARVVPSVDTDGALVFRADVANCGQAMVTDPRDGVRRSVLLWCLTGDPGRVYYEWDGVECLFEDASPRPTP